MIMWDPNYMLLVFIPTLLLSLFAQWKVRSAFEKWDKVPNQRGLTGTDTAQAIIRHVGLEQVGIAQTPGHLTDHYDPRSKTINLSESSTARPSVASMAIVAHELGHAEQDKTGNTMLRFRAALVPAANLGSKLGLWIVLFGLLFRATGLAWLGIILFGLAVLFTIVTLPVEFDASRKAKNHLRELNLVVSEKEAQGVSAVLDAAALTYVAAAAAAVLQLLYFVSRVSGSRR